MIISPVDRWMYIRCITNGIIEEYAKRVCGSQPFVEPPPKVGAKQFDILGLGAVSVDDFIYVQQYPPADSKTEVLGRDRKAGGLTAIALATAARLGASCAYAGVLGTDELSEFALDYLKAAQIDISFVKQTRSARPVYSNIIVDQHNGARTILYDLSQVIGANPKMDASLVRSSRVLFVDHVGVPGMVRAARIARSAGIPVVADFDNDDDPGFGELLKFADHVIVSESFATRVTGTKLAEKSAKALGRNRDVAVVTCGGQGCWYIARDWKAPKHQSAFAVKAVDTTGCGDVFHGAYAFALARGFALDERVRFASAAAALKAGARSGSDGLPTLKQVQKLCELSGKKS
jgi:sulfofructose kinase